MNIRESARGLFLALCVAGFLPAMAAGAIVGREQLLDAAFAAVAALALMAVVKVATWDLG